MSPGFIIVSINGYIGYVYGTGSVKIWHNSTQNIRGYTDIFTVYIRTVVVRESGVDKAAADDVDDAERCRCDQRAR